MLWHMHMICFPIAQEWIYSPDTFNQLRELDEKDFVSDTHPILKRLQDNVYMQGVEDQASNYIYYSVKFNGGFFCIIIISVAVSFSLFITHKNQP